MIDVAGLPHLKELSLKNVPLLQDKSHQLISCFPLLEDPHVGGCHFLRRITISSTRLGTLSFYFRSKLEVIDIDTPNLISFNYKGKSIPTCSTNAPCPLNVVFQSDGVKAFVGLSNQFEDLIIRVTPGEA